LTKIGIASGIFNQPLIKYAAEDIPEITITHSNGTAVAIACQAGHIMGIDIEKLSPDKTDALKSQLTENEINIAKESGLNSATTFNQIWTIKEALSKALKCGLTTPFKLLEISKPELKTPGKITCYFKNFGQYKGYSWAINDYAFSIVLPKKSSLKIDLEIFKDRT
jgi:4'-phosphopantetheinyl transferase